MNPDPKRVESVFAAALAMPADAERLAWLEQACVGDPDLRKRVEELLEAHQDAGGFLKEASPVPVQAEILTIGHLPTIDIGETSPKNVEQGSTVRYFGDYEVMELIARGGMGVVYRARQVSLNRIVALKMILSGESASSAAVQRFRQEAESAANLDHPNILPIYEVGEYQGQHYFSMKLIGGGSLAELVSKLQGKTREIAKLVETIASAVHFAHQRGILHRDLKPANILLEADGTPVITDFGLAKKVGDNSGMTQSGAAIGTPSYMPPEQARGSKDISTSADVYSLGAILYELLTGQPPFKGESVIQTLRLVVEQEPVTPRALNRRIDKDLSTIAMKCLEKDAAKRYASAEALANDLQRWRKGEPVTARRAGLIRRTRKWLVRNPIPAILLLTAVVASTIIVASLLKTRKALADAQAQMYVSAIQLASRDANEKNFQQAEDQLGRAPEELRGWEWHHINRIAHPEAAVWEPNLGGMKIVGSQDGKTLLAAISSTAGIAALIDPETGQKTVEFARTPGTMNYAGNTLISLSADSQRVAICDGLTAQIFNRDGTLIKTLTWPVGKKVMGMALDSNGRRLAVTTFDHRVQVRDIESGEFSFDELRGEVMSKQPGWRDGDQQLVVIYKLGLGIETLSNPKLRRDLSFLEIGKQLPAKQGLDNEVNVYEGLALSQDGKTAAIGGVGIILIINLENMTIVRKLECEFAVRGAVKQFINLQCLVFSPDGHHLVGISPMDRAVRIWGINSSLPLAVHYGHPPYPLGAAFLPGGSRVVTVGNDVKARVWDVPPKPYPHAFPENGQKLVATYMEVSRDGKYLAVGEDEGYVSLYDTQTEKLLWRVRPATRAITQLTFSPDGTRIGVAPGWEGSHSARGAGVTKENRDAIVLATESGATLFKLTPAPGEWSMMKSISFRSDGKRILTAGGFTDADGDTVREWDAATGAHLADFDVGYVKLNGRKMNTATSGVAYDPSGRDEFAVCGSNHPDTHICSAADGKGRMSLVKHGTISNVIYSDFWVGYSCDGRFIVTHDHTTLGVWERHSCLFSLREACQYRFRMNNLPRFTQVAISPDGLRLALASENFIIIRSTLSGEELIRIPAASCEAVAFHPDGKRLYAGFAGDVVCYDP